MGQRYESSVNYAFIFINFVRRMAEMLKIERAALRLGGRLLFRDLDMDVAAGQWVCVTGESGCGKTSLLRAVLGFLPLEAGRVSVCGEDLSLHTVERIRRRTAYVPQELFLPADTVEEMMRIPFDLKANRRTGLSLESLFRIWEALGLGRDLYHRKVGQLSGGQRQRIILSMAALLGKRLLLADEPTSALDEESVGKVAGLLRGMAARGAAVVSVSHNRTLLEACDRVVRL